MICKGFYNSKNLTRQYLGGKVYHYPIKEASVTLRSYKYRLSGGETIHSVAITVFGEGLDYLWPFLADNNPLRHPDDWSLGDFLKLPELIIKDTDTIKTLFTDAVPTTTSF